VVLHHSYIVRLISKRINTPNGVHMSAIKLIVSDLHLADGRAILDGFGARQLAALKGLLSATGPGGAMGDADDIELIINGDCFDFLAVRPYLDDGIVTPGIALEKWGEIVLAHHAFFKTLGVFLRNPGRRITFIAGNHDAELAFAEVREALLQVIEGEGIEPLQNVSFCETRFYRPLPDVYIEHGHQYDFWNHVEDVWDDEGNPLSHQPAKIRLPVGTQYFQRAAHAISEQYPYFDHIEPSIDTTRQIALLCLLKPEVVVETAKRTMTMLSYPRVALDRLSAEDEHIPARLFERAMLDFAAFQQDMIARKPAWQAVEARLRAHAAGQQDPQVEANAEFYELHEALSCPTLEAVKAILEPKVYPMGESVAMGMQNILRDDPTLRYAIAGHTHMLRRDALNGDQEYLNTATWTIRETAPRPGHVTPELVEWLREPLKSVSPLQDITQFVFGRVDATGDAPSKAYLCAWEGGEQGQYRLLP